jgi:hypothetical protein
MWLRTRSSEVGYADSCGPGSQRMHIDEHCRDMRGKQFGEGLEYSRYKDA